MNLRPSGYEGDVLSLKKSSSLTLYCFYLDFFHSFLFARKFAKIGEKVARFFMRLFVLLLFPFFLFSADDYYSGVLDEYLRGFDSCYVTITTNGRYVHRLSGSLIYDNILRSYKKGDLLEAFCNGTRDCVFRIHRDNTPSYNQKQIAEDKAVIIFGDLREKK
ncbi:MAG: hypothetical protein PHE67_07935 [Campylobacterales bacterium]|nr:hypothetical protein [Campylobacterales bacterium]